MMGLCDLCIQLLALLYIQGIQGSTRLDSLTCTNDFKTQWMCHWKESAKVNKMLPMNLYYRINITKSKSQQCIPNSSQNQEDDLIHMSCNFTDTLSSITGIFKFLPKSREHAKTHIIPSGKVRMPPPEDLTVHMSDNGSIILSWKMPKNAPSPDSLAFQIIYHRKYWETLEDAAFLTVFGKMEVSFKPESMARGSSYLFRVRSALSTDLGCRSTWSEGIVWTMPEDEGAIPQNVHCEYDGLMEMRCSWEVRKDLVSFVSFALYYTVSSTDREETCVGKLSDNKDGVSHVQYTCTLQVPPFSSVDSFNVQLRPVEEVKTLEADKNIQLDPPIDLQIKDELKHGYILRWHPPGVEFSSIKLTYQLCYWKQGDPGCTPQTLINVSNNLNEYYIPLSKLEGSTKYTAKVRAKPDEEFLYDGPWSVWSTSCSWKTPTAGSSGTIYIITIIPTMVLSVFALLGYRSYKRLKQRWDDSLPNPSKSQLLLDYRNVIVHPYIYHNFYAEEEQASICVPVSLINKQTVEEPAEELLPEKAPNPLGPYSFVPPPEKNIALCLSECESQDTKQTKEMTVVPTPEHIKSSPSKKLDDPYMMHTCGRTMSDLLAKQVPDSRYFTIPTCQGELFNFPKEVQEKPSQPVTSKDQMAYVHSMKNQIPVQTFKDPQAKNVSDGNKYFAVPLPSDFTMAPDAPLMILNPDGSGPLMLKQVGDYSFIPGFHGSQENIERKKALCSEQKHVPQEPPLPAVQVFKVMQRGYFALPQM